MVATYGSVTSALTRNGFQLDQSQSSPHDSHQRFVSTNLEERKVLVLPKVSENTQIPPMILARISAVAGLSQANLDVNAQARQSAVTRIKPLTI